MQYLLSKEEYDDLVAQTKKSDKLPSQKELQKFCTMIANTLPVVTGWYKGKVWGCILTKPTEEWYCDDCPANKVCPHPYKEWSK